MDVLALLRSKNRCLERFLEASREFLVVHGNDPDLGMLPDLQKSRESALKAIGLFDQKLEETVNLLPEVSRSDELIQAVRNELARKDAIVEQILKVDLELISRIEAAKNAILRDLSSEKRSRDTLGKFKSTWVPSSGEGLDETL